ncbi:hypothetical protein BDZ85DRAFT_17740 [Elsinoe ampelina]|uniref:Uncharacterized protein n=1 Tax=Elsinoe ampelina TaxID=302913 RepID=A0A6A6G715_9PEZI|nr:hypothetical protein BDZ85DRAFT_17740 [Elsinoe ampelina]
MSSLGCRGRISRTSSTSMRRKWIKYTVWKHDYRDWYKNNETGRVKAVWPGSSLHYMKAVETPRWEDFEIEYKHEKPWAALGMGWTLENCAGLGNAYPSPYLKWRILIRSGRKLSLGGGETLWCTGRNDSDVAFFVRLQSRPSLCI